MPLDKTTAMPMKVRPQRNEAGWTRDRISSSGKRQLMKTKGGVWGRKSLKWAIRSLLFFPPFPLSSFLSCTFFHKMIINEYRVINNCTEEEYQVGKIADKATCMVPGLMCSLLNSSTVCHRIGLKGEHRRRRGCRGNQERAL